MHLRFSSYQYYALADYLHEQEANKDANREAFEMQKLALGPNDRQIAMMERVFARNPRVGFTHQDASMQDLEREDKTYRQQNQRQ